MIREQNLQVTDAPNMAYDAVLAVAFSSYLPYGVYFINEQVKKVIDERGEKYHPTKLKGILGDYMFFGKDDEGKKIGTKHYKAMLRPLSDLVKEIGIDGNKFIPLENLFGVNYSEWDGESETTPACVSHAYNCSKGKVLPKFLPYWVTKQLIEWHFDVFELIENGYAVAL